MRVAFLEAPQRLVLRETPEPRPADGDVVVAVELAGVCGSDVALYKGLRPAPYPLLLGHEAVGRVVAPGRSGLAAGTRVVVEPNIACGVCPVCRAGHGNVCPNKRSLGVNAPGAFADRAAVPAEFVHPVPEGIALDDAVAIEPLAVAVHAFGVGGAASGSWVPVALLTAGVCVMSAIAASTARETYRVHMHDLGKPYALEAAAPSVSAAS